MGKSTQETTQEALIPGFALPGIEDIARRATGLVGSQAPLTAPLSEATMRAQGLLETPTTFGPLFGQAEQGLGQFIGGMQNPFGDLTQSILNQISPSINAQFSQAGRFGSPAQQRTLASSVTERLAPFLFQDVGRQQGQQLQSILAAPQFEQARQGLDTSNIQRLLQSGAISEQQAQAMLGEPFQRLGLGQSILGPLAQLGLGQRQTETQRANPFTSALGFLSL